MSLRNYANPDNQATNRSGGLVHVASDDDRFIRALTIGADMGTFYVDQESLSVQTIDFLKDYISKNPQKSVETIREVSSTGRAAKNSHSVFALAVAFSLNDPKTTQYAKDAFLDVVRTTFDLTEFLASLKALGAGMGRAKKNSIASWYESRDSDQLAYQVSKYRQRGGYSHRDMLRISHPEVKDENLVNFILSLGGAEKDYEKDMLPQVAQNYLEVSSVDNETEAVSIIQNSSGRFAWEFLDTSLLNSPHVWKALLEGNHVGYIALLRNLSRLYKIGLLDKGSDTLSIVKNKLVSEKDITSSRVHPMHILNAMYLLAQKVNGIRDYYFNLGVTSSLKTPVSDELNKALVISYSNIKPTGKKISLAVDVSASMNHNMIRWDFSQFRKGASPRQVSAMLASLLLHNEESGNVDVYAFSDSLTALDVDKNTTVSQFVSLTDKLPFSFTNAALQIEKAVEDREVYDAFITITDNETQFEVDNILAQYRKDVNPDAKLVVISVTGDKFSVNDPHDLNGLDVCGADAASLNYVTDFIAGR